MTLVRFLELITEYAMVADVPEALRVPAPLLLVALALLVACGAGLYLLVRLIVLLIKKLSSLDAAIDAVTRYTHVRGRNRSRDVLSTSIAKTGTGEEKLEALREVNRHSPLDSPGSCFVQGQLAGPAPSETLSEPRDTTVVIPPPKGGGRHRAPTSQV